MDEETVPQATQETQTATEAVVQQPSKSQGSGTPGTTTTKAVPFYMNPLVWLMAIVWLWLLHSWNKQKKQQASRKAELDSIKKGDKVVTIGRLHGIVEKTSEKTIFIKPTPKSDVVLEFDRVAVHKADAFEKKEDGDQSSQADA